MTDIETLSAKLHERFAHLIQQAQLANGELTLEIAKEQLCPLSLILRDDPQFDFKMLIDVCGVDYLHYGIAEWETDAATARGFERGVKVEALQQTRLAQPRFAVVYHLLSLTHNQRLRLRVFLTEEALHVPSVVAIWPAANWFEREAFDLFGIRFTEHPDLRRLLTDYGFAGHPFRKDFPLSGNIEVRYDAALQRVIYEPVNIAPRILEPKVIRRNNRNPHKEP